MRFQPTFLDEIRARVPVSDVVGRRVKLQRRGREFVGLSPFSNEKTPSFTVNDQKAFYHCFSTGNHGDVFKFLTDVEGLPFPEAVERLAAEAGLDLPKPTPEDAARERKRASLYDVMEAATLWFEGQLGSREGADAMRYLRGRELDDVTRQTFRIGYAPKGRYGLKEHLAAKGITADQMEEAGLVISGDDIAVSFDRFRDRVIFPIPDSRGRIIAFGGRALSAEAQAKYLNSPETPLFHKGHTLYNYAAARKAAHESGKVIVAEGYMDVIALSQAGFANVVAPLGTAITERQLALLWRLAPEPVLCFDGDAAGRRAAQRAMHLALKIVTPGTKLSFALLPAGTDPDDLVREKGAGAIERLLAGSSALVDMLWASLKSKGSLENPDIRSEVQKEIDGLEQVISDKIVQKNYQRYLRNKLWETGRSNKFSNSYSNRRSDSSEKSVNSDEIRYKSEGKYSRIRERDIIKQIVRFPELLIEFEDLFSSIEFESKFNMSIQGEILSLWASRMNEPGGPPTTSEVAMHLQAVGLYGRLAEMFGSEGILKSASSDPDINFERARQDVVDIAHYIYQFDCLNKERLYLEHGWTDDDIEVRFNRILLLFQEYSTPPNQDYRYILEHGDEGITRQRSEYHQRQNATMETAQRKA